MASKGEQKKTLILNAVQDVAQSDGMSLLSIANVARRAGVAKSVVLYHFSSRDALLDAAMARWQLAMQDRLRAALEPRTRDPRDRLGAWIAALFATDLSGWHLYFQLSLEAHSSPAAARAAAWEHDLEDGLSALLGQGHKQLAWRAAQPRIMATTLRCLVEGLILACVRTGEPATMARAQAIARQSALDLLLR